MIQYLRACYSVVASFFGLYLIGYSTFLLLAVLFGALDLYKENKKKQYYCEIEHEYFVPISILVPAFNEEVTVVETVKSLLALDYKLYEIVVIDDGSTDDTSKVLCEAFPFRKVERPVNRKIPCKRERMICETIVDGVRIVLVQKENGGKSDSLNMGINVSRFPYFICMDADSVLQRDSLINIARPVLEDDSVVAVGGLVRIVNNVTIKDGMPQESKLPLNPIVGTQILEYDRSFMASRIFLDKFNGNLIISGAFGLFKKDVVVAVGGYDTSTMGEDMELVVRLHSFCRRNHIPYRICYAVKAVCWSQCPTRIKDLKRQRRRWYLGLFQCMLKHRYMFFNRDFGLVGWISWPYFLLYELLSPFIELLGMASTLVAYMIGIINMRFMVTFYVLYACYGAILTLTAFLAKIYTQNIKMGLTEILKAIYLCLAEAVFLRYIQTFARMSAFAGYRKRKNEWGKIARKKIKLTGEGE